MEFREALYNRRSIRQYTAEPVSKEELNILLDAAMRAPSACNKRPWEFYVITNQEALEKLRGAAGFTGYAAQAAIVVCGNLSRALPMQLAEYWIQDCSAATENILLAAADLGLGTVWCGIYPQERSMKNVREILSLNEKCIPLNVIYVGHSAEAPESRGGYDAKRVHFVE